MEQIFGAAFLVPFLVLVTFGIVLFVAARSQAKTRERMRDPNAPKSTLAADGPNHKPDGKGVDVE